MATFYANPDDSNEIWMEKAAFEGSSFRIWHYIFFCMSAFTVVVVLICCCIRIRVPRTKQEIEADYHRKKLAEKFRQRLKFIRNQDIDALDLERALAIIQEDYKNESETNRYALPRYPGVHDQGSVNFPDKTKIKPDGLKKITNVLNFLQSSSNT